ncbi:MAG TPA: RNA polymerase sigma factor [Chitinophagaceae bacterium]|nr:RNA polymerase sigma factor [Chitinophagaceae bacterium]
MTDDELIKGCIKEDGSCQRELFRRYAGKMLGVCQRYARSSADAEDIVQDAFIKVFEKIHQFKSEGSFEGWIRKIVVNTALKKYTVIRYDKEVSGYEITDRNESFTEASAYAHLNEKELLGMINNLPDGYRLIFNLYVIEGYQHEEIAQMLKIQPGTSRSQLVKARNMLKERILKKHRMAI